MYFYKDTTNNIFYVGDDVLPAGRFLLRIYDEGNKVAIEGADTHELTMSPTEVTLLQKENGSYYTDLAELLVATKDFFKGGFAGDVTSLDGRVTAIEDTQIKILYYEEIDGTTTSGQISPPTGATILFDQWANGEDAVVSNIVDGKPNYLSTNVTVDSLDSNGNYTLSGTLGTNPAAFIYWILVPIVNFGTLNNDFIIDQSIIFPAGGSLQNVITVAQSGGHYNSVKAAMDSITDNDETHRYLVSVAPGVYTEDNPIQGKSYVNVEAQSMHTVRIVAGNPNEDLFIGANLFYIIGFSFVDVVGAGNYAVNHSVLGECVVKDCVITDCSNGILVNHTNAFMNILDYALYTPNENLGIGINVLAGNVTLSFLKVVAGSTINTVLNVDGTNTTVLLDTFTAGSPNITTGINADNDASISGFGVKLVAMVDGMIISGTGTSIKLDALQILSTQNDGFRIENVGTGINVQLFATTISECAGLNFNILNPNSKTVGNGFTEIENSYLVPGAQFYTYILDSTEGDAGLHIFGEVKVGSVENPTETSMGEGDSTIRGMKVFTYDGSSYVDVTAAAKSASGSIFTFPNLLVNSAVYIASELVQAGDYYKHHGIKTLISTAAVGGTIIMEYWDGGAWVEENASEIQASGKYFPFAKQYFQRTGAYQVRYNPALANDDWTANDIMTYGTNLYWTRFRITSQLTTAPIFEQWKYHTSCFEPNEDGFIEYKGKSRPIGQLTLSIGSAKPIAGNMQDQSLWISQDVGIGFIKNKFTTTTDILGFGGRMPFNMDTSAPISLIWSGLFSQSETPVFTVRWAWAKQGDPLLTGNPGAPITNSDSLTVSRAVTTGINEIFQANLDISELIGRRDGGFGDELWISVQITTLSGTFSIATGTADYTKWCEGGHI